MPRIPPEAIQGLLRLALSMFRPFSREGRFRYPELARRLMGTSSYKEAYRQILSHIEEPIEQVLQYSRNPNVRENKEKLAREISRISRRLSQHLSPEDAVEETIKGTIVGAEAYPPFLYTPLSTPEKAREWAARSRALSYVSDKGEREPALLFHVTTALPKVREQGIRASVTPMDTELSAAISTFLGKTEEEEGLGGYLQQSGISTTPSLEAARNTLEAIRMAVKISRGETNLADYLRSEINAGRGKAVSKFLKDYARKAIDGMWYQLQDRKIIEDALSSIDKLMFVENPPKEYIKEAVNRVENVLKSVPGKKGYKEYIERGLLSAYLRTREEMLNIADPILLGSVETYKKIKPEDIGVIGLYASPRSAAEGSRGTSPVEILDVLYGRKQLPEGRLREFLTSPDATEIRIVNPRKARAFEISWLASLLPLIAKIQGQKQKEETY